MQNDSTSKLTGESPQHPQKSAKTEVQKQPGAAASEAAATIQTNNAASSPLAPIPIVIVFLSGVIPVVIF